MDFDDTFGVWWKGFQNTGLIPPAMEHLLGREDRIANRIRVNDFILRTLRRNHAD